MSVRKNVSLHITLTIENILIVFDIQRDLHDRSVSGEYRSTSSQEVGAFTDKTKTPWPVVRKRTIPAEQPPLVGEVSVHFSG
jgi:hypothetical protein